MGVLQSVTKVAKSVQIPFLRDAIWSSVGWAQTVREFVIDARAYLRDSTYKPEGRREQEHRERDLVFSYHQVEKGLTFPATKRPFGARAAASIEDGLRLDKVTIRPLIRVNAQQAMEALSAWNDSGSYDGRVAPFATERYEPETDDEVERFFGTRWSCRNYDPSREVTVGQLTDVVRLAQSAPSVCNRQAARVHILEDPEQRIAALRLQNGNRGFGDSIPHLAVITVDRRFFKDAGERNQRWIDGGLFAMTFVWALHARSFASCMLNWSLGVTATRALRGAIGLSEHEDVICLVAFGHPAAEARAARSARHQIDDVLTIHKERGQ